MRPMLVVVGLAAVLLAPSPGLAHKDTDPPHQRYAMGDLTLESGEVIKDFAVSYVTHGTLDPTQSNAILVLTAIGGNHHRLDFLIGPGKALDPDKFFVVAVDAIGNGLTTSPSNSTAQPHMKFPRFAIRDMVQSQHRLLTEHLGVKHVIAVVGASMGGMQALQWGVSYPDFADQLIAMTPLLRTPAWTVTVLEASRKAIMLDPAWQGGEYTSPPEAGIRLWRDIVTILASRTPEQLNAQFPQGPDVLPWLKAQEDALVLAFDANDWIYQTWAYEQHDISAGPERNGDMFKTLRAIKSSVLILTGIKDLLNPEWEARDAFRYIPSSRAVQINPASVTGHMAASGAIPDDVDTLNREIAAFIERGQRAKQENATRSAPTSSTGPAYSTEREMGKQQPPPRAPTPRRYGR
ncbi:MAG TPA: alpha/beta fold hydrolase [Verrucomicrobiae bacterium]|jgi:homoserine O-acetyltransferase|nr:alpha/beta fold hydrolase [Verrucomicrobiae bacterium]